jgi:hypothetical protein
LCRKLPLRRTRKGQKVLPKLKVMIIMLNNLLIANSKEELLQVRSLAQMGGKIRKDKMSM